MGWIICHRELEGLPTTTTTKITFIFLLKGLQLIFSVTENPTFVPETVRRYFDYLNIRQLEKSYVYSI